MPESTKQQRTNLLATLSVLKCKTASFLTLQSLRKKDREEGKKRIGKGSRNGFNINCSVKTQGTTNSEEGLSSIATRRHFNASGYAQKMSTRDSTT